MSNLFSQKTGKKLRGVNLGGWLVLEKWMTPSLFADLQALDETSFCVELGDKAGDRLRQHWQSFITEQDFAWLAQIGINAVRIPVGHWLFGPDYPYHARYGEHRYPYVTGGVDILDQAFIWAERHGLLVVLDLHAAPGCQNGFDNGGIQDVCEWHTRQDYIDFSLDFLERLAKRYHLCPALHGIQVLNEPRWDIDTALLKHYTTQACQRIRKYCADDIAVIYHDGFRSFREYGDFLKEPDYRNVILDIHRYQCFDRHDIETDIYGHCLKSITDWKAEADAIITETQQWTYVGEWSLGLDLKIKSLWAQGPFNHHLNDMDDFQLGIAYRGYAATQLSTFEKYLGWFFWSYKTETMPAWSFVDCVANGWLPNQFR